MTKKTKVQIEKELESRTRYAKDLETDLKFSNALVAKLEQEKAQRLIGWSLTISTQTITGEYANLRKIAMMLLENGFWFFQLEKV